MLLVYNVLLSLDQMQSLTTMQQMSFTSSHLATPSVAAPAVKVACAIGDEEAEAATVSAIRQPGTGDGAEKLEDIQLDVGESHLEKR